MKPPPKAAASYVVHPLAPTPGLSFSICKMVGGLPWSRPDPGLSALTRAAGPLPLATTGIHAKAPAVPAGPRPPAPPGMSRSSPLLDFISPRQHGPHRGFPEASGPSSPPQQQASLSQPLCLPALPRQRTCAVSCARQGFECACLKELARWNGNLEASAIGRNGASSSTKDLIG